MGPPDNRKVLKKKMSTGNLRSPIVKRTAQAPVTLQGWLWKQGSDGFMRWKRRWFVLSDFCLFYYKGPEEDKVLGSILLPSYSITPCPNENKVMKKFAFKAEHQNMRTYYFAADTKESLQQWLNAMAMATLLQKDANSCQIYDDHLDSSHCSDSHNTSTANEDEDSGFTSYHSRRYIGSPPDGSSPMNGSYTSESLHLPDERYCDASNDSSRLPHERNMNVYLGNSEKYPVSPHAHPHYYKAPKARQHVYANAPPKPRRLAADPYGTVGKPPSTEQMIYNNGVSHHHPDDFQDNQHDYPPPEYSATNKSVGSPANKDPVPCNRGRRDDNYAQMQQATWDPRVEYSGNQKDPNEYSETTRDPSANFHNVENSNRMPRQSTVQGQEPCFQDEYDPAVLRQKGQRLYHAQRPHSANFLEYDDYEKQSENPYDQEPSVVRRAGKENMLRPKSSIEQYATPPNYWNEVPHQNMPPPHTPHTNPQAWGILEQSPMSERNGWYPENQQTCIQQPHSEYYSDAKYVTSVEMISPRVARETRAAAAQRDPQFMRSASARLPSSGGSHPVQGVEGLPPYSQDDLSDNDPKRVQQREESMKRLLEWKQRMLQSPFTKKHLQKFAHQDVQSQSPSSSDEYRKPVMVKKDTSMQDMALDHPTATSMQSSEKALKNHESTVKLEDNKRRNDEKNVRLTVNPSNERILYQPPPSIHASARNSGDGKPSIAMMNQYRSSYSSDDEESGSGSFKGLYLSRTQPRRRTKTDLILEEPNLSDPELHLRNTRSLKLPKYGKQQADSSEGSNSRLSLSAGDLLGKTHEELILLLIQLRRTQARLQKAIDTCRLELEGEKKLVQIDVKNRESHSRKVEELTIQLEEYMKQSDVNIPLVNLVDNMVKLGSLYGDSNYPLSSQNQIPLERYPPPKKMIEFTRRLQEQRLAQNEWPEWRQLVPDQKLLQDKLQHLYMLDKSLQEESVILTNLQQDKEMLERALAGIHMKADANRNNANEQERLLQQQHLVECELGKVQSQLAFTMKKLEETASENTKIEREILLLRQKIQNTIRRSVPNPTAYVEDSETVQLKLQLEEELAHVQTIMEELSKRRNKINGAVQQLKDDGQKTQEVRPSPTGVAGSAPLPGRKHARSTYLETDLDTLETRDALDITVIDETKQPPVAKPRRSQISLYVNSNNIENKPNGPSGSKLLTYLPDRKEVEEFMEEQDTFCQDINEADERMKRFYGILPRDKPSEVKTVRIVKRESERRNKTKDRGRKVLYDEQQSLTRVLEEPDAIVFEDFDYLEDIRATDFQRSMSLPRNYGRASYIPMQPPDSLALTTSASSSVSSTPTTCSSKVLPNVPYYYRTPSLSPTERFPSAHERLFGASPLPNVGSNLESPTNNPLATPVFQSEAARQIVAETAQKFMSSVGHEGDDEDGQDDDEMYRKVEWSASKDAVGNLKRRHKRRHYTISSSQPLVLESRIPKLVHARSRDDLDMERCLRSANTPDVVKSTIKKTDTNFDESTIDRELGLPQKIVIPERYVEEEEEEELTAEEKLHRMQKAESIKKMLSETTTYGDLTESEIANASETLKKKFEQEKKQRAQLLSLNQLLAQEVKERSKAVAAHTTTPRTISSASHIS